MTHIPRPYQTRTVADVLAAYAEGVRRVCVVAPPGAGKTTIGAEVVCAHPQARTLWLANRIELIDQAAARLRAAGLDVACISPRHAPDPWAKVQVASLDTLTARGQRPPAEMVVKDECFPPWVFVALANGRDIPIDDVRPGQELYLGGRVRRVIARETSGPLLAILHESGALTCTPNHPIYVRGKGYVEAQSISDGDLLCVWSDVDSPYEHQGPATPEDVLLAVHEAALFRNHGGNQSGPRERADAGTQSDAQAGGASASERNTQGDRSPAEAAGRQREGADRAGGDAGDEAEPRRGGHRDRADGSDGAEGPSPDSLQARRVTLREPRCDRGRWGESQGAAGPGPTQGRVARWSRVERVAFHKPASDDEAGGVRDGGVVYNLETDSGCYVADGVLVHNCHHAAAETYSAILESYPEARHLGLTATPQRQDGKALDGHYDRLVVAAHSCALGTLGANANVCRGPSGIACHAASGCCASAFPR